VAWLIANDANEPIWLNDAWVPHGRFRGDGHVPLSLTVEPGGSVRLELSVASAEPAGTVVENAFLILRMASGGQAWRVFARMRIEFDATGRPLPIVENVTVQSAT
jgi:hypothetical protein